MKIWIYMRYLSRPSMLITYIAIDLIYLNWESSTNDMSVIEYIVIKSDSFAR